MPKKCETYPSVISKEIYEKELEICKQLYREDKCCWGNCEKCGVIPLLYKLHTGKIIHGEELEDFKLKILNK